MNLRVPETYLDELAESARSLLPENDDDRAAALTAAIKKLRQDNSVFRIGYDRLSSVEVRVFRQMAYRKLS